jgi:hypothetical protein
VLCSLEAELAGELVAEGAVLGSQAGVLGAGGIEPVGCHNARTTLLGWVSRDRQAALRYSLISPLTVVRRLIGAVMSLASPGSYTGG